MREFIIGNHRKGNLAVARAFGDFQYKRAKDKEQLEQPVSCLPDVHFFERSSDDEYIVMACDGVYDVLSNDELVSANNTENANTVTSGAGVFGINTEVSSHAANLPIYRSLYISFSINHLFRLCSSGQSSPRASRSSIQLKRLSTFV